MNLPWSGRTRLLLGPEGLGDWLSYAPLGRTTLLVDPALTDATITTLVEDGLERAGHVVRRLVPDGAGDADEILELSRRTERADLFVAVGGGTCIDRAKLAVVAGDSEAAATALRTRSRCGLLALGPEVRRTRPLLAVPTTVGPGSELSRVACMPHEQGKRLVSAEALTPDAALLDGAATETLPGELLAEGILEALFRTVTPYAGDHKERPVEDAFCEAAAGQLALLGYQFGGLRRTGRRAGPELRLDIARLSGLTHSTWMRLGRSPFTTAGWIVANELSTALNVRKMTAVAALLPSLWRAVLDGDERYGSAARLRRIWGRIREAAPAALPEDPALGIAVLIDDWGIGRTVTAGPERVALIARRTTRAWGAGLPMLGGLLTADVQRLLDTVCGNAATGDHALAGGAPTTDFRAA
ncbi:iron-containing alcohol dehydrogenase [Streptomyces sp. NBC_00237]|uniref:daptide-type RiPP biosynthesis dehydogenase n=1 Tax=Streptomyces sp. NBC_00237 TaxID=2975687 RepID=UPI00224D20C6|nr:daptide-type RiPP biosynthesis dehydogenase [Streptomyces sp. NBC_00237]MCX5200286.1 iron-containing alcohol dehydrogenase [Streptomyces sp. NBC_00237]